MCGRGRDGHRREYPCIAALTSYQFSASVGHEKLLYAAPPMRGNMMGCTFSALGTVKTAEEVEAADAAGSAAAWCW